MQRKLENLAYGVAQQNLSPVKLGEQQVPCPPVKLIELFDSYTRDSYRLMSHLSIVNEKLKKARDLLLPRLMSGEITV